MSKIIKVVVFMSIAIGLYGCDFIFGDKNMLDKKIENIEFNKMVKVENLIDGQWDFVCVLVPYQTFLKDGGNQNIKAINKEIENKNLSIDEGHWHLVLKDAEKTFFISEKVSRFFSLKQGGFNDAISGFFSESNFSPLSCADFNEAYLFKYKQNNRVYLSLGVKAI